MLYLLTKIVNISGGGGDPVTPPLNKALVASVSLFSIMAYYNGQTPRHSIDHDEWRIVKD